MATTEAQIEAERAVDRAERAVLEAARALAAYSVEVPTTIPAVRAVEVAVEALERAERARDALAGEGAHG